MKTSLVLAFLLLASTCYSYNVLLYCSSTIFRYGGFGPFRCNDYQNALTTLGHPVTVIDSTVGLTDSDFVGIDIYIDDGIQPAAYGACAIYSPTTIQAIINYLDSGRPAMFAVDVGAYGPCNQIILDNFINPYIFDAPISDTTAFAYGGVKYMEGVGSLPFDKICILNSPNVVYDDPLVGYNYEKLLNVDADSIFAVSGTLATVGGIWSLEDAALRLIVWSPTINDFQSTNLSEFENMVEYLGQGCPCCPPSNPFTCDPRPTCVNDECVLLAPCPDDGDACTINSCQFGACSEVPACPPLGNACQYHECTVDGYGNPQCDIDFVICDDGNACTEDFCDPILGCQVEDISDDCNDGNACTAEYCDPTLGCVTENIICDDGNPCTIDECDKERGCQITHKFCDDSNPCTEDSCDIATGDCVNTEIICDDGVSETIDFCDEFGQCQHTSSTSTPSF